MYFVITVRICPVSPFIYSFCHSNLKAGIAQWKATSTTTQYLNTDALLIGASCFHINKAAAMSLLAFGNVRTAPRAPSSPGPISQANYPECPALTWHKDISRMPPLPGASLALTLPNAPLIPYTSPRTTPRCGLVHSYASPDAQTMQRGYNTQAILFYHA